MRTAILTEAGPLFGLGHLTRCLGIYDALVEAGARPLLCVDTDVNVKEIVGEREASYLNWKADPIALQSFVSFKLVIVDSYVVQFPVLQEMASWKSTLVVIDDLANRPLPGCVVWNSAFYANSTMYNTGRPHLLGPAYIPLRKAFWDITPPKKHWPPKRIFLHLAKYHSFQSHFRKELERNYADAEVFCLFPAKSNQNEDEVAAQLMSADLAFTAGGQTLYELLRCLVPSASFAVAQNQRPSLDALDKQGLVYRLPDLLDESSIGLLLGAVQREPIRPPMPLGVVDGQGARRGIKKLLESWQSE